MKNLCRFNNSWMEKCFVLWKKCESSWKFKVNWICVSFHSPSFQIAGRKNSFFGAINVVRWKEATRDGKEKKERRVNKLKGKNRKKERVKKNLIFMGRTLLDEKCANVKLSEFLIKSQSSVVQGWSAVQEAHN